MTLILGKFLSPDRHEMIAVFESAEDLKQAKDVFPEALVDYWQCEGAVSASELFQLRNALERSSRGIYGYKLLETQYGNSEYRSGLKK